VNIELYGQTVKWYGLVPLDRVNTTIKTGRFEWAESADITQRKKAEYEKRESEKAHAATFYARNLIEASLDPLVTISADGKITDVNEATEKWQATIEHSWLVATFRFTSLNLKWHEKDTKKFSPKG